MCSRTHAGLPMFGIHYTFRNSRVRWPHAAFDCFTSTPVRAWQQACYHPRPSTRIRTLRNTCRSYKLQATQQLQAMLHMNHLLQEGSASTRPFHKRRRHPECQESSTTQNSRFLQPSCRITRSCYRPWLLTATSSEPAFCSYPTSATHPYNSTFMFLQSSPQSSCAWSCRSTRRLLLQLARLTMAYRRIRPAEHRTSASPCPEHSNFAIFDAAPPRSRYQNPVLVQIVSLLLLDSP